jgi:S-adenosylmethionine synthetase
MEISHFTSGKSSVNHDGTAYRTISKTLEYRISRNKQEVKDYSSGKR